MHIYVSIFCRLLKFILSKRFFVLTSKIAAFACWAVQTLSLLVLLLLMFTAASTSIQSSDGSQWRT